MPENWCIVHKINMYWHGIGRNRTYFLDGGAGREPLSPNLSI